MKIFSKVLAVGAAAALALSMTALAADPKFVLSDADVELGTTTAVLELSFTDAPMSAIFGQFEIAEGLTIKSVETTLGDFDEDGNVLTLVGTADKQPGKIAKLTFDVDEDAELGDTFEVTFTGGGANAADDEFEDLSATGTITIVEATVPEPTPDESIDTPAPAESTPASAAGSAKTGEASIVAASVAAVAIAGAAIVVFKKRK